MRAIWFLAGSLCVVGGIDCGGGDGPPVDREPVSDGGPSTDGGAIGSIHPPSEVLQIVTDALGTTYARLADGRVFRWGRQLDDGDRDHPPELPPALHPENVIGDGPTVDRRTFEPVLWARDGSPFEVTGATTVDGRPQSTRITILPKWSPLAIRS